MPVQSRKIRYKARDTTALQNPLGMAVKSAIAAFPPNSNNRFAVVRVGKEGERTHLYDHKIIIYDQSGTVVARGAPLCKSGFVTPQSTAKGQTNPKVTPQLYKSDSEYIDCYRCIRLIAQGAWTK